LPTPDLSPTQSHQEIAQVDHLRIRCALDAPDYDTSHRSHQQAFGNRFSKVQRAV
jgi:hypothetical protein